MSLQRLIAILSITILIGLACWYSYSRLSLIWFVKAPPRPVHTEALLDDHQLAISDVDFSGVDLATRSYVQVNHHPIRSFVSNDFSDLTFLRPLVDGKRVVLIGESSHGVAEFNWLRVRLIKYLHQELGYDVIAYESSISDCDHANTALKSTSPREVMKSTIFSVWHTAEILQLFEYVKSTQLTEKPLTLAGLDIQPSSSGDTTIAAERFRTLLELVAPDLAAQVLENDQRIRPSLSKRESAELIEFYRSVLTTLESNRPKLLLLKKQTPLLVDLTIQEARSRIRYVAQIGAQGDSKTANEIRDEGMSENLRFLLDRAYPGRKLIVLASNHHIAYDTDHKSSPRAMGSWMLDRKQDMFSIGMFMGQGVAALEDAKHSLYRIQFSASDELAKTMASAGRKLSFMDFSKAPRVAGTEWMFRTNSTRVGGFIPLSITPAKSYDAAIYIHEVSPPLYLN